MDIRRGPIPYSSTNSLFLTGGKPEEIDKDDGVSCSSAEEIASCNHNEIESVPPPEGLEDFWVSRPSIALSQKSSMRQTPMSPDTPSMGALKIMSTKGSTRGSNGCNSVNLSNTPRHSNGIALCSNDSNGRTTNIINIGHVDTKGLDEILKHHSTISEAVYQSMVAGKRRLRDYEDVNNMNVIREDYLEKEGDDAPETADESNKLIETFNKYQRVEPDLTLQKFKRRKEKCGRLSSKWRHLVECRYPYSYSPRTRKLHPEGNLNRFIVSLNKDQITPARYRVNKPVEGRISPREESQRVSFAQSSFIDKQTSVSDEIKPNEINQMSNCTYSSFILHGSSDSHNHQIGGTSHDNFQQSHSINQRHHLCSPALDASMASIDLLISRQVDPIKRKLDDLASEIASITPNTSVDAEVKLLSRKVDNMVNEMTNELREIREIIKKLGEVQNKKQTTSSEVKGFGDNVIVSGESLSLQIAPQLKEISTDSKMISKSSGFSFTHPTIPVDSATTSLTTLTNVPMTTGFSASSSVALDLRPNAKEVAQPPTAVPSFTFGGTVAQSATIATSNIIPVGKFGSISDGSNSILPKSEETTAGQSSKAKGGFLFSNGPSTVITTEPHHSSLSGMSSIGPTAGAAPASFSFGTNSAVVGPSSTVNPFSSSTAAINASEGVGHTLKGAATHNQWTNLSTGATAAPSTCTNSFETTFNPEKNTALAGFGKPQSTPMTLTSVKSTMSYPFCSEAALAAPSFEEGSVLKPNPVVSLPVGKPLSTSSGFNFSSIPTNSNVNTDQFTGKPKGAPPGTAFGSNSVPTGVFGGGTQTTQGSVTSTLNSAFAASEVSANPFSSQVPVFHGGASFGNVSSFSSSASSPSSFLDKAPPKPKAKKRLY